MLMNTEVTTFLADELTKKFSTFTMESNNNEL